MKHTQKWLLEHYECEGQTEITDFIGDVDDVETEDMLSPCDSCFRDNCIGCIYPEEVIAIGIFNN